MAESSPSPKEKRPGVDTRTILLYLIERKWKYLSIVATLGIATAIILKFFVLEYSSSSSFFVNDIQILSSAQVDLKSLDNLSPSDNFGRIYQQVNSTEMLVHLINKFNLCKHYGIDTTEEFYLQKAITKLSKKISVSKTPFNTIIVSVSDKYRYFAPDIANEILLYLNVMNKKYYIANLEKKLSISHAFLAQMKADNDLKSKSLDSLIFEMRELVGESGVKTLSFWLTQQDRLRSLVSNIENSTHDLMNSERLYNLALQAMTQKDFPAITVVLTAMPESRSNAFTAILYTFLLCIAASAIIVLQAYARLEYANYIDLIFKSGSSNQ